MAAKLTSQAKVKADWISSPPLYYVVDTGGPAGIRTLDTRIKSPMLCQAELQARVNVVRSLRGNSKRVALSFQGMRRRQRLSDAG